MNDELRNRLNAVYGPLNCRTKSLVKRWRAESDRAITEGYFSGHYTRMESGQFEREEFPIPVLTIEGLCDIEIHMTQVVVTTKMSKADLQRMDPEFLQKHRPEVYGVKDFLQVYAYVDLPWSEFQQSLRLSPEEEFFLSFQCSQDASDEHILDVVSLLDGVGFYY